MITVRRSAERGYADHGWLKSFHSFSFADYHDPAHMRFGALHVLNEDRIAPGSGFGAHGHRDMEIVSIVLEGALGHEDSLGNGATILPGEVQRMSAGSGIRHSESNHAPDAVTHFLQIWIEPSERGIVPGYEQKRFAPEAQSGHLQRVASPDAAANARDGALLLHADARIHLGRFDGAQRATLALAPGRLGYVHVARGAVHANGRALQAGDALELDGEPCIELADGHAADVIVFDLAR